MSYIPKYFNESDFAKCNPPCKVSDMRPDFMRMLDIAREHSGKLAERENRKCVYVLTSAYRTKEHEIRMKRNGTSSHIKGLAVDIRCNDSATFFYVYAGLIHAGFRRIGINFASKFIHVDSDPDKPQDLLFSY
jgi:uncharacterized protein YcbK (DUF882 family)